MITCNDKCHEDEYENGKLVPLKRSDMVGRYCVACHEARMDQEEFNSQNEPDLR